MDFIRIVAAIFVITVTTAVILWERIIQWADNSLFPWIERNLAPRIVSIVRQAFAVLDRVAVSMRNAVRQAWQTLRQFLLKVALRFQRKSSRQWVKQWTAWLIKKLDNGQAVPVRRVEEEEVSWSALPDDVRAAWLQSAQDVYEMEDLTQVRDREIQQMTY